MNRLTKVIGITGAVAAVVWLLRDRIITVGIERDEEPPRFRTTSSDSPPPEQSQPSMPVTNISGIGPTYAARLEKAGITDARSLAASQAETVAAAASVSTDRARQWIDEARAREPSAAPAS